jgi:hypothetical protein
MVYHVAEAVATPGRELNRVLNSKLQGLPCQAPGNVGSSGLKPRVVEI